MKLPVLIAAEGAGWEAALVLALERGDQPVEVVRRCVDIVELLAVAISGQARAVLVSAQLRRLDADAVDRLGAAGVAVVGVICRDDVETEHRLRATGVTFVVPEDADPAVVAEVLAQAVREGEQDRTPGPSRTFTDIGSATVAVPAPPIPASTPVEDRCGTVVVVWGPTGAPGRSTTALGIADELSRLGRQSLLIDADSYGGSIAPLLGLLDESPGLAAACRQAGSSKLGPAALAALCWQLSPTLRVLTGIPRADRWPELRVSALDGVLGAARQLADFTVLDTGFCLETDEELSFDSLAPRRNGLTLAALDRADVLVVVGSADPLGLQRLVRGLAELGDAQVSTPAWVVLNRVRPSVVPGDPAVELSRALDRFAGRTPAALLPLDQAGVDEAISSGRTLAEAAPGSPLRAALGELASALAGIPAPGRRRHRR